MNPTTPSLPAREPLWLRFVRSIVAVSLALALTILAFLLVAGHALAVHAALAQALGHGDELPKAAKVVLVLTCLFVVLLPLGFMFVASRRKWITGKFLAAGWAAVLPVLGWLSWDETAIRHPLPVEEFSPAFAGAEQSYAVLMQYSKQHPSDEAKAFEKLTLRTTWGASTREPAKWLEWVAQHRETLESDWATLAPQRRWLEALGAFDRIGDFTPSDLRADIPAFKVWRTLAQRSCAQATLLALDGRRDEAIATLAPMLEAGRKLQPSSRTLVRPMIGIIIERMCVETAGIVLDLGSVSAAARARLAAALGAENSAAMARRLILVEYAQFAPTFFKAKLGDTLAPSKGIGPVVRGPLNLLGGLFVNPNATINLLGQHVFELAALAEARQLGKFSVRQQGFGDTELRRPGMKNLFGRLMVGMAMPPFDKMLDSHWKTADLREALRQRLTAQSLAAATR